MDPGGSGVLELPELFFLQQAEGYTDLDRRLPADDAYAFAYLIHLPVRKPLSRCDDGIAKDAGGLACSGACQQMIRIQQGIALRAVCAVMSALGAVSAVLGTAAAFSVDDGTDVKAVSAEFPAELICGFGQFFEGYIRQQERFFPVNLLFVSYLLL